MQAGGAVQQHEVGLGISVGLLELIEADWPGSPDTPFHKSINKLPIRVMRGRVTPLGLALIPVELQRFCWSDVVVAFSSLSSVVVPKLME